MSQAGPSGVRTPVDVDADLVVGPQGPRRSAIGIDLASQDAGTAACRVAFLPPGPRQAGPAGERGSQPRLPAAASRPPSIVWTSGLPVVTDVEIGVPQERLEHLLLEGVPVGLDAPLGWPDAFVSAIRSWHDSGSWAGRQWSAASATARSAGSPSDGSASTGDPAGAGRPSPAERRDRAVAVRRLRLREADQVAWHVGGGHPPLSVSTDRIALVAMRAVSLLDEVSHRAPDRGFDRLGGGQVFEVYPEASLRRWNVRRPHATSTPPRPPTYKGSGPGALDARRALLTRIVEASGLRFGPGVDPEVVVGSDHVLDALVCALTARSAADGDALAPPSLGRRALVRLPPQASAQAGDAAEVVYVVEGDDGTIAREGWIWLPHPVSDVARFDWAPHAAAAPD